MQATTERQQRAKALAMTASYQATFGTRSASGSAVRRSTTCRTWPLLPVDDPRRTQLERAISTLSAGRARRRADRGHRRGRLNGAAGVEPVVARHSARARRQTAPTVHVEALPASYGDAILVTYGDDRHRSRMLIDAGPANAFKKGVRSRLGDMHLDLMVITHVDADHIDGAIQLLLDKE